MRAQCSLFQSHLDLAHQFWVKLVQIGDCVVNATAGNGFDAVVLAKLALDDARGRLYLFDIQQNAIDTRAL